MESALLFVHTAELVPRAREAANRLLAHRRRTLPSMGGEVLGTCVPERLDEGLVAPSAEGVRASSAGVAFRECVALAGIRSLCWFDLAERVGLSRTDRRRILLDAPEPDEELFPFLAGTPAEAQEDVSAVLRRLEGRDPALEIGRESFVDHREGGVVRLAETATRDRER